jgi:nucleoside-diphosphate-sugar epimerase
MKTLVLGSSGQIGNPLCEYLIGAGDSVEYFDIENTLTEDLRVVGNELLEDRIAECEFVHFLAFDVGGSVYLEKYQNAKSYIDNNMRIMLNTFDALERHNKRFLFASSQMSNMDYSTYGTLKRIGEHYTNSLGGLYVKFWNVYGHEHDEEKSHVITDFINMATEDNVIQMRTTGDESRQFLHTDDCSRGLHTIQTQYEKIRENIGDKELHLTNDKWTSIHDIAEVISSLSGCEIRRGEKVDMVQRERKNPVDGFFDEYWTPMVSLEAGISDVYAKMLEENSRV